MTNLTPESRADLRTQAEDTHYVIMVKRSVVLALLDAADLLDEVRDQVRRGALCPMCSTGMTRQTVGMICQICGTNYGEEYTR